MALPPGLRLNFSYSSRAFSSGELSQLHELRRLQSLGQAAIELNERAS